MESGLIESFTSAASKLDDDPGLLSPSPFEKAPTHVANLPPVFSPCAWSSSDPLQTSHIHEVVLRFHSSTMEKWQIYPPDFRPEH